MTHYDQLAKYLGWLDIAIKYNSSFLVSQVTGWINEELSVLTAEEVLI